MNINGVFDNTSNKQYNDSIPKYDAEDGIDNVKCECNGCCYRDIDKERCLFETCIYNQFPFSVNFHTKFTRECKICGNKFTVEFSEEQHPFVDMSTMCDSCTEKLKTILMER